MLTPFRLAAIALCLAAAGWSLAETQAQRQDLDAAVKAASNSKTRAEFDAAMATIAKTASGDQIARSFTEAWVGNATRASPGGIVSAETLSSLFNGAISRMAELGIDPVDISRGMHQAAQALAATEMASGSVNRQGFRPTPYLLRVDTALTGSPVLASYADVEISRARAQGQSNWFEKAADMARMLPPIEVAKAMARSGATVQDISSVLSAAGSSGAAIEAALYAARWDGMTSGPSIPNRSAEFSQLKPPSTADGMAMLVANRTPNPDLETLRAFDGSAEKVRRSQIMQVWYEISSGKDKDSLAGLEAQFAAALGDASGVTGREDKAWFTGQFAAEQNQRVAGNFVLPTEPTSAGPVAAPVTAVPFVGSSSGGGGGSSTASPS